MNTRYDAIVIGAGAIGSAAADELGRAGLRVAVVAPTTGEGVATLAAGAMVDAFGEIETLTSDYERQKLALEVDAQRIYPGWLESIIERSGQPVFHKQGLFVVSNNGGERDKDMMALMRAQMKEYGEKYDELDGNQVPGLKPNYLFRAQEVIFIHNALCVDTTELLGAFEVIMKRSSVTRVNDRARRIVHVDGHWDVMTTSGERISADNVAVCAGAYSLEVLGEDYRGGLPKLYYGRGSSCTVTGAPAVPYTIRTPNRALSCGIHLVPRANNRLYFGATNLFGTEYDGHLPTGPTVGELHTLFEAVQSELNTSLRNVSIEGTKWGLRPVSQFDRPILGGTGFPGLFLATGTHRTGVSMAPVFAKMLADEILGRRSETPNPYSLKAKEASREAHVGKHGINVQVGIRSLIATILFPTGRLPYNRLNELEVFMTQLYKLALTSDGNTKLRERLLQIHDSDVPLDEQGILRIYHQILEECLPEGGPYPT